MNVMAICIYENFRCAHRGTAFRNEYARRKSQGPGFTSRTFDPPTQLSIGRVHRR